ncbi:choice-of-anchor D domain-containing protein [Flavobacterium franklandianum]|uniref:choice-of-anchor D domain-containing protein n=1 Tax=Flavobacterium franklandianum TaxID=2594430 RepID=UPI00117B8E8A|nr:choice-of-anchor D domain-containing protein [Flavobacterium franklandianum]TRX27549.1 choice-of-anchor D domain-containing protein [Flavobacterium franklandianum]
MKTTNNIGIKKYLIYGCLFIANLGFSQTQTFTTSGTFIVPVGVTNVTVEAWGAGGAGGGCTTLNRSTGGGGGGGTYTKNTTITVTPGASITVTVGAGGTGVSAGNGNPGGTSTFASTVPVTAIGGNGGNVNGTTTPLNGLGATAATGITYTGGAGGVGNAVSGTSGTSGGGGGGAGSTGSGAAPTTGINAGIGGNGSGGNGAAGKASNGNGTAATALSGGGSGGRNDNTAAVRTGGNGFRGQVIITWIPPLEINIQGNTTTIVDGDTSPSLTDFTDFGSVDTSSGTTTKTFTIQNTGGTTLTIGTISFSGTNAANFTITTNPSATVTAGASTTFVVSFNPSALGLRTATISIVNDDADENPYDFSIQGTGTEQEINILGNATTIVDGDSTPSITDWTNFGSVDASLGTITKTFTVQNTGSNTLTIGTISISGTNASEFNITTNPSATLTSGASTTFVVTFDPSATGTRTATIAIANNDTDENPYNFNLEGTGTQTFFDSDGDGIYDNVDIDDDNDGILDVTEETNCKNANGYNVNYKFLDENFGTGSRTTINTTYDATTTYCYADGTAGTNTADCPTLSDTSMNDGEYTVGSSAQIASWAATYWYVGGDHTSGDTNGRMALFNASYTPGIFYTALITGALPNIPITYSFWVINLDRTDAPGIATRLRPNIKVEFRDINDVVLSTISTGAIAPTTNGNSAGDWYQFTSNLTLNVNAFKVIFINNETGGLGNDLALDDILITQTLCDRDGDGIADVFDLDADNDGIEDVIEAGLGNISNGKGKIDANWVDSNGNGLHDSAESTAALPALDSDGDGISNYIDLDSDNDSLFDVDESGAGNTNAATGFVNGDGDITGDGRGDGPETEAFRSKDTDGNGSNELYGDGILDIYDYGTGANQYGNLNQGTATANPATTFLLDTDSDGIPDYLDTTSNGSSFDIANTVLIYDYKTLDANNNGIIDGTTDIDKDGILDTFDTNTAYFGSPRDLNTKLFLDFDGRNDYGQSTAILGGLANASMMAWIDLNSAFSTDGIVVGQEKFQIRINSEKKLQAIVNSTTVTHNTALNVSQWYNVGAIYNGIDIKLYLNGVVVATQAATGAIATDTSLLTIGKDPSTNAKFFKGKIDEVRVFNVALTDSQLQRMVYQEIQDTDSKIRGAIIPKNIAQILVPTNTLPFTNLLRYYRMDVYKDDIIDDLTTSTTDLTGTKIYNHKNIFVQQAPMPFLTERTGNFATAVNSPTKEIRGLDIMDQDWSIVIVQHNITETSNNTDLGMIVNSGKTILMNNDTKIQNDWYLKLDGKIDLVEKSQLLQTTESDLSTTSSGSIERDQQGQNNLYNYNYWSSPVSPINTIANNTDYTVAEMLKDGTTSTPQNINWIAGYNGSATLPISLARYWLYTFDNYVNAYANWNKIVETTPIRVGQGFTLKGSGAEGTTQNYTFLGKPNNGLINSNTVLSEQLLLTGNPYPSALDAVAFINDNIGSIDGNLYFWEHYSTNYTHVLREYQGGYATLNLVGGVASGSIPSSVDVDFISGLGTPSKGAPNQYIPVGQGFFVTGKTGFGGTVVFNNNQRAFYKEDETGLSNIMFKTKATNKTNTIANPNNNYLIAKDTLKRIRLGFNANNNYHRQLLLGFMNEKATNKMDYGYDGNILDDFPNDMYFLNGENQLVIQGEGFFDVNACFPIGVKTALEGKVSFIVDALENFKPEQSIYIYDNLTDTYHDIRITKFEVDLPIGNYDTRFSLRFKDKTLKVNQYSLTEAIQIFHIQNGNYLEIKNKSIDFTIEKVTLYTILGQSISTCKIENQEQENIQIPIKTVRSGVYIAKLKTSVGEISKKVIVFDE